MIGVCISSLPCDSGLRKKSTKYKHYNRPAASGHPSYSLASDSVSDDEIGDSGGCAYDQTLASCLSTTYQLDPGLGYPENAGKKARQVGVRLALNRRSGNPDLELAALGANNFVPLCPRMHPYAEQQVAVLPAVPAVYGP